MSTTDSAALSVPEQRIWESYARRLTELRAHPRAAEVLAHYHLEELATGPLGGSRLADLAVGIHRLEHALDPARATLPPIALMEPDDVQRHPGFDQVEEEVAAEENHLLTVWKAIHVS